MCVVGVEWGWGEEVIMTILCTLQRTRQKAGRQTTHEQGRCLLKITSRRYLPMRDLHSTSKFFFPNNKMNSSILIIHWYEALIIKANSIPTWAKYVANMGFLWKQVKRDHFRKRSDGPSYVLIEERVGRNALGLSLAIGLQLPLESSSPSHPQGDRSSPNPPHPLGYLSSWSRLGTFILSLPGQGNHP